MYTYNISQTANGAAFKKACVSIESSFKSFKKDKLLIDVDGSQIQIYRTTKGTIKIFNDYEVDAVYADSDVDLTEIFGTDTFKGAV